jgi:HlyD family secretion protein
MLSMSNETPVVQIRRQIAEAAARQIVVDGHRDAMRDTLASTKSFGELRKVRRRGVLLSVVPFALLMGGLAAMPIPGAVITSGYLTSETAPKLIQSAESGVIEAILVKDGDRVSAGDQVIALDDTGARAELGIVTRSLDQLAARNARLDAEALGLEEVAFPEQLTSRDGLSDVGAIIAAERALFALRRGAHVSQLDQMGEQAIQIEEQVKGINGQISSLDRQHEILVAELESLRGLLDSQLVAAGRVSETEQNLSIVQGEQAELRAAAAAALARRAQLASQMVELEAQRMSDAAEEQREVQALFGEASEKQIAARRRLQQMVLMAPVDGTVTDLRVRTIGGVANASETLLTIIPADDRLIAELKVSPRDISNVRVGQEAELRFTSIGGSAAPEFSGQVIFVAPDLVVDQRTGSDYFIVRVEMGAPINDQARALDGLGSGTPVEVFLLNEARTVIEYIAKPIVDQARRAFR